MKYMLSFDNENSSGKKNKLILLALNKNGIVKHKIYLARDKGKADIEVDFPLETINDYDLSKIHKNIKFNDIEKKVLKKAFKLSEEERKSLNISPKLKLILEKLKELSLDKLKKNLIFDENDVDNIVPAWGINTYDRSIFIAGPSGSGKSYYAKLIICADVKKRICLVFSKVGDDVSLNSIREQKAKCDGESRFIQVELDSENDLMNLPSAHDLNNDGDGTICLFDDVDSFQKNMRIYLNEYRNSLLESGRHKNISVITTSHHLANWSGTKTPRAEAEYVVLFPSSNKYSAIQFLKTSMGIPRNKVKFYIDQAMNDGRYITCKLSAPNMIITAKSIFIL